MREYTKEDLVEFLRWNSNAPVSALRKASKEELEAFMSRKEGIWNRFFDQLDKYRECRQLEQQVRTVKKALGI